MQFFTTLFFGRNEVIYLFIVFLQDENKTQLIEEQSATKVMMKCFAFSMFCSKLISNKIIVVNECCFVFRMLYLESILMSQWMQLW